MNISFVKTNVFGLLDHLQPLKTGFVFLMVLARLNRLSSETSHVLRVSFSFSKQVLEPSYKMGQTHFKPANHACKSFLEYLISLLYTFCIVFLCILKCSQLVNSHTLMKRRGASKHVSFH